MSTLQAKRIRYSVFKDDLRMGLIFDERGMAYEYIENRALEDHPDAKKFLMLIGINRRYRHKYTLIKIVNAENVVIATYRIVPETTIIRLTESMIGDFQKQDEE